MKIKCTVDLDEDLVSNCIDNTFAYCRWWKSISLCTRGTDTENTWTGHVMSGGSVAVVVDDVHGDTGAFVDRTKNACTYRLDRQTVEKGLQALADSEKYAHHFADIVADNCDAITGDVLVQFALFGTVVYD